MTFSLDWKRAIRIDQNYKITTTTVFDEKEQFLNKLDDEAPYCICCHNRMEPVIAYGGDVITYICQFCPNPL